MAGDVSWAALKYRVGNIEDGHDAAEIVKVNQRQSDDELKLLRRPRSFDGNFTLTKCQARVQEDSRASSMKADKVHQSLGTYQGKDSRRLHGSSTAKEIISQKHSNLMLGQHQRVKNKRCRTLREC